MESEEEEGEDVSGLVGMLGVDFFECLPFESSRSLLLLSLGGGMYTPIVVGKECVLELYFLVATTECVPFKIEIGK